jgi:hypothetical protein
MGIEPTSLLPSALGSTVHLPSLFQPPPQGYRLGGPVHPYGLLTPLALGTLAKLTSVTGITAEAIRKVLEACEINLKLSQQLRKHTECARKDTRH